MSSHQRERIVKGPLQPLYPRRGALARAIQATLQVAITGGLPVQPLDRSWRNLANSKVEAQHLLPHAGASPEQRRPVRMAEQWSLALVQMLVPDLSAFLVLGDAGPERFA